ncbi:MAG: type VI secretion system tube protein TssD [Geobacteraceae bacterium]|nr:type VI secretion system tube protein TssD [Geobacteraceae bacterium]
MALPYHITLEGEKQGKIEGSCELIGRERSIIGYWFMHQIKAPHDPASGSLTEKAAHHPLRVIIAHDKSSPKLHQALCTGEHFKYVNIDWYSIDKYGDEYLFGTIRLEDAIITRIQSFMPNTLSPDTAYLPHMEKVSFHYKYIRWTYYPDGIEAEDPYVKEYGKQPLKDIGAVMKIAGSIVWEGKVIAVKDAAKAALFEFFELPWYLDKAYTAVEIHDNVSHELHEKALRHRHNVKQILKETYRHK